MCSFKLPVLRIFYSVIILVAISIVTAPAHAVLQTFSGPWDPTAVNSGFSLRATSPGSSATMEVSQDQSTLTAHLTLANCHHGCGAFYLDNTKGNLPYGHVQFEWLIDMNDRTDDGQIGINGADNTQNDGARDILFYPSQIAGSADIDYQGGTFTFFNIGIGALDTGNTTATLVFTYFSAPDAPITNNAGPNVAVAEPAGLAILLLGAMALYRVRRPRAAMASVERF